MLMYRSSAHALASRSIVASWLAMHSSNVYCRYILGGNRQSRGVVECRFTRKPGISKIVGYCIPSHTETWRGWPSPGRRNVRVGVPQVHPLAKGRSCHSQLRARVAVISQCTFRRRGMGGGRERGYCFVERAVVFILCLDRAGAHCHRSDV